MSAYFNDPWFWLRDDLMFMSESIRTYGPSHSTLEGFCEGLDEDRTVGFLGSTGKGKQVRNVFWWGKYCAKSLSPKWVKMFEKNQKEFFDTFPEVRNVKLMHYIVEMS